MWLAVQISTHLPAPTHPSMSRSASRSSLPACPLLALHPLFTISTYPPSHSITPIVPFPCSRPTQLDPQLPCAFLNFHRFSSFLFSISTFLSQNFKMSNASKQRSAANTNLFVPDQRNPFHSTNIRQQRKRDDEGGEEEEREREEEEEYVFSHQTASTSQPQFQPNWHPTISSPGSRASDSASIEFLNDDRMAHCPPESLHVRIANEQRSDNFAKRGGTAELLAEDVAEILLTEASKTKKDREWGADGGGTEKKQSEGEKGEWEDGRDGGSPIW